MAAGSRLLVRLNVNKNPFAQANYGTAGRQRRVNGRGESAARPVVDGQPYSSAHLAVAAGTTSYPQVRAGARSKVRRT